MSSKRHLSTTSTPRVVVMDTSSPYKHSSFSSVLLVFYLIYMVRPIITYLQIMDLARREAMDAQRFDPLRRKKTPSSPSITLTETDMGQVLRRLSQPELPSNGVGGIWSDHELVLVPLDVTLNRDSIGSIVAESVSSSSSSDSATSAISSASTATYFTSSSPPTAESGLNTSPSSSSSFGSRQIDTYDRDDLIITRTIIRPTAHPSIRGLFSRPSSPMVSRPTSPLSRPTTPVFQALNCFRPSASEGDVDDIRTGRTMGMGPVSQPVLQVIVTQTREQYEQDLAFKEAVQEVYPEASRRRRAAH